MAWSYRPGYFKQDRAISRAWDYIALFSWHPLSQFYPSSPPGTIRQSLHTLLQRCRYSSMLCFFTRTLTSTRTFILLYITLPKLPLSLKNLLVMSGEPGAIVFYRFIQSDYFILQDNSFLFFPDVLHTF